MSAIHASRHGGAGGTGVRRRPRRCQIACETLEGRLLLNGSADQGVAAVSAGVQAAAISATQNDTTGPVVTCVQRIGVHWAPTRILITFNEDLDPASASNPWNYRISQGAGYQGRSIGILSANYDAATRTVTLCPAERLYFYGPYRLCLDGTSPNGIKDLDGNLLDGNKSGYPGSNFNGVLLGSGLTSYIPRNLPTPPVPISPIYPTTPHDRVVWPPIVVHHKPWFVVRPFVPRLGHVYPVARW